MSPDPKPADNDSPHPANRLDTAPPHVDLVTLREPILALATAARVCGHWMRHDSPDIGELRALVAKMIEAAEHAAFVIKR